MTPGDLVSGGNTDSAEVVNIARFLQTLDDDGNPDNGILVSSSVKSALKNVPALDFKVSLAQFESKNSAALQGVLNIPLTGQTGTRPVKSETDAKSHLNTTVNKMPTCSFAGVTVPTGSAVVAYEASSVSYGNSCNSQDRVCGNGVIWIL